MGTLLDVVCLGNGATQFDVIFQAIEKAVSQLEEKWSNYKSNSTISRINKSLLTHSQAEVPQDIFRALKQVHRVSQNTDGLFNCWGGQKYNKQKFSEAIEHENYELTAPHLSDIIFDEAKSTIVSRNSNAQIDSGGFGKGLAINAVREILDSYKVHDALISFGGSSIYAKGQHPYGPYWPISIPHYYKSDSHALELKLYTTCVSISGHHPGQRKVKPHGHVFHPENKHPVDRNRVAIVHGPDAVTAEVLSTAFLMAPSNRMTSIAQAFSLYAIYVLTYDEGHEVNLTFKSIEHEEVTQA